jgi:hypothetical protein
MAKEKGWDTIDKAIIGGAIWIRDNYTNEDKNTLYKMRWQPTEPTGIGQYATDIGWACKQCLTIKKIYDLFPEMQLRFDIPVYIEEKPGEGLSYNKEWKLTGISGSLPIVPRVVNDGERSAANYDAVINQFDLSDQNSRYWPDKGKTYCNIFLWDVTMAMGVEIPHWLKNGTNDPYAYNRSITYKENASIAHEVRANEIADWLKEVGIKYGWRAVSAQEAQMAANLGKPTVGVWHNPKGIGHVVIVRPNLSGDGEIHIAQAGASNYSRGKLSEHKSSSFKKGVVFYVHE